MSGYLGQMVPSYGGDHPPDTKKIIPLAAWEALQPNAVANVQPYSGFVIEAAAKGWVIDLPVDATQDLKDRVTTGLEEGLRSTNRAVRACAELVVRSLDIYL